MLLMLLNAGENHLPFVMPKLPAGSAWRRVLDTSAPDLIEERATHANGAPYDMPGRAVVLFELIGLPK
jgi:glycogen operon protein